MKFSIDLSELSKKERIRLAKVTQNLKLLSILAEDKEWRVKAGVARNKNVTVKIIENLYNETIKYLSEKLIDENLYNEIISALIEIANNIKTPIKILQELAAYPDCRVKAAAAKNPKLPEENFKILCEDYSWEVMAAIASGRRVTEELLYKFFKHENCNVKVKQAIAKQSKTPVELLVNLVIDEDSNVSMSAIKNLRKKKI